MMTVKEIAKLCEVSPSTVSNILNGKTNVGEQTRQKVLDCVRVSGYQPNYFAQSIRNQGSRMINIITEDLTVFGTNPIVESIMACCDDNNYRTILMNLRLYRKWRDTWYEEDDKIRAELKPAIQEAMSIRVNGIIYVAGHCRVINYFPDNFQTPVVIAYGMAKENKYPSIVIDDEKGGYDTTKYLIAKKHKKIGVIAGAADNLHTKYRLLGYQKALYEEGVLYNPSLIYYGDWERESGYDGIMNIFDRGVTAVFCMNDKMAAGAYDFLNERKISVGEKISVIGYDNMDLSDYLRPRLTTSEIQLDEIGRKAAEIMINLLENPENAKNAPNITKMPCKIIERESVEIERGARV